MRQVIACLLGIALLAGVIGTVIAVDAPTTAGYADPLGSPIACESVEVTAGGELVCETPEPDPTVTLAVEPEEPTPTFFVDTLPGTGTGPSS